MSTVGRPGDGARASLRDVAQLAGVALSSASRVLSGHPDVSEAMRGRVLAAAESLGYESNLLWHGLRQGATYTVGVVVRDISSPQVSTIALEAEGVLQQHGYSMLLSNTRDEPELDASQIRLLDQRRVDALLVSPNDTTHRETLANLERLRVPWVAVDRDLSPRLGGGAVLIGHELGARLAAERLVALGHRSVGLVSPPLSLRPGAEVANAMQAVIGAAGGQVHTDPGPFTLEHGAAATARLLDRPGGVTAIVSGSSQLFPGVLGMLRERGLRIPSDLSLIAVEDIPLLSMLDPPVSAISRRPREVGREAARMLLDMLGGGAPSVRVVPTSFTDRGSAGPPPK